MPQAPSNNPARDRAEPPVVGIEDMGLMDLRKEGLTEESVNQSENDKGIHETAAMRVYYRQQ